jgi:hypothetical protein
MASAARDAQHFNQARTALKALVAAGSRGVTGKALLGESWDGARWGYMMLRRLEQEGMIRAERPRTGGQGHPLKVFFPTDALADIVNDDEELGALLWPKSYGEPEVIEDEDEDVVASAEAAMGRFEGQGHVPEDFDAPIGELEPLAALLTMTDVVLQNVTYMREQLAELKQQVAALTKAWE